MLFIDMPDKYRYVRDNAAIINYNYRYT